MSNKLSQYRVFCTTENIWKYVWDTIPPNVCPGGAGHTLNTSSISILKTVSQKGRTTEDDRQEVALTVMPSHHRACFVARADDITNGLRGKGERFHMELTGASPVNNTLTFQFTDPFDMVGGYLMVCGANKLDYCSMEVYTPASPVVPNGGGTGNCNVISGRIIPAPLNNGAYDVNLTEALNSNLNGVNPLKPRLVTKVCPVSAYASDGMTINGYYDYDEISGAVTVSTPGKGKFNLYAIELTIIRYITDWPGYHPSGCYEHIYKVSQKGGHLIPHWRFRVNLSRDASHAAEDVVDYYWGFDMSRQFTV